MIFSLLSIVIMTVDHRTRTFEPVREILDLMVFPLRKAVDLPSAAGDYVSESLVTRRVLLDQVEDLQTRLALQNARLQKMEALESENIRLRSLLDSSFQIGEHVLIAELVNVALDPYRHEVLINKGTSHNVYLHQPVIDANGVVGQVVHTGLRDAQVILITDPSHALPVQVNRTGMRAIAVGSGATNRVDLLHIPSNADIREGDLLVTSGLGGRFPPGYPVATVTNVINDPGRPFAQIHAEPKAHLNNMREVLLVWRGAPSIADKIPAKEPTK